MNNYLKQIQDIKEIKGKPRLLLHVCCGVCSVYPLLYLRKYFRITIYFANSNIYPYSEYGRRLEALEQYLRKLNDHNISLIIPEYDYDRYDKILAKYAKEPEGGNRCYLCYSLRMEETYRFAEEHGYDYCTTVMSISNRKKADYLNQIGERLEMKYPNVKYLHADFKKGDGITLNEKLNKELDLYHQNYCGCRYSIR